MTIEEIFRSAGAQGWLCVQSAESPAEVAIDADAPVVAASVIKVLIAIAAESAFDRGDLDPTGLVTLAAADRTPGPVGFSLFEDDVSVSGRDLVSMMLTISDNMAADTLLRMVGLDRVNRLAGDLGLSGTEVVSDLATMITSAARGAGFLDWAAMAAWTGSEHPVDEREQVQARVAAASALDPTCATRTTARDMCHLLRLIWEDRAGPAPACERVRLHLSRQLTRHRLAAAFPTPARVAAKSGGLFGIVRNEVGVIEQPSGQRFYAAVFTRTDPQADEASVNSAIAAAAAASVRKCSTSR